MRSGGNRPDDNLIGRLMLANVDVLTFDESSPQARRDGERAAELLEAAGMAIETHLRDRVMLTRQPAEARDAVQPRRALLQATEQE